MTTPNNTVAGLADRLLAVAERLDPTGTKPLSGDALRTFAQITTEVRAIAAALASPAPSAGVVDALVSELWSVTQRREYATPGERKRAIRTAITTILSDYSALQHPAAPSVSPAVEGGLPELPATRFWADSMRLDQPGCLSEYPAEIFATLNCVRTIQYDQPLYTADQMRAYGEQCRLATAEQPGSAVQGEAISVYATLRSIRYNATHGSQDRPMHVRLSLIADEANKAIAAIEATTPPPAPAAEQAPDPFPWLRELVAEWERAGHDEFAARLQARLDAITGDDIRSAVLARQRDNLRLAREGESQPEARGVEDSLLVLSNDISSVYGNTSHALAEHLWRLGYRKAATPNPVRADDFHDILYDAKIVLHLRPDDEHTPAVPLVVGMTTGPDDGLTIYLHAQDGDTPINLVAEQPEVLVQAATIIQRVVDELREEEHERRQEDRNAGVFADTEMADQLATWANQLVLAKYRFAEAAPAAPGAGVGVDEDAVERAAMELYERNEGHLRHADWGTTPNQAQYRSDARAALQAALAGKAQEESK